MSARLFGRVKRKVFHQKRTRTDKAHFAAYNVEEFGQFVQREGAEQMPKACQPLGVREQASVTSEAVRHRAEFINIKGTSLVAGALLFEEDRCANKNADKDRGEKNDRGKNRECDKREGEIE